MSAGLGRVGGLINSLIFHVQGQSSDKHDVDDDDLFDDDHDQLDGDVAGDYVEAGVVAESGNHRVGQSNQQDRGAEHDSPHETVLALLDAAVASIHHEKHKQETDPGQKINDNADFCFRAGHAFCWAGAASRADNAENRSKKSDKCENTEDHGRICMTCLSLDGIVPVIFRIVSARHSDMTDRLRNPYTRDRL